MQSNITNKDIIFDSQQKEKFCYKPDSRVFLSSQNVESDFKYFENLGIIGLSYYLEGNILSS